ncbi:flavin-containing monooxygenase [Antrihabitans stalactiti]|uniref:NAD(P)/FAD-dependent oxidoreductase n=1 Tax=Antrihabitans stalactiti TaxID=2584121 RepID=A0A848KFQ5_9NOCA|nr:NAD(P)/FAD-dependent oxidoreductase [Antrihabitans stalactiti]NMN95532.1 NAD(P)/FAD-dependent oxidoreductase [Antrihabitans stalactiti]
MAAPQPDYEVVVIGAGVGGICAGVRLKQAGIDNFLIVDRADDLGGTWRDNTYPGVAVDIPSIAYQYTFDRNPNWSRVFAPGAEVQAYHNRVVDKFGLRPHFRFRADVQAERWDDDMHYWHLTLGDGSQLTARFVVSAVGPFLNPKKSPGLAGLESFSGVKVVPSQWQPEHDIRGKRVGVIGTGATGVQLAGHIAAEVESMVVFQRTPVYCVPKPDFAIPRPVRFALHVPGLSAGIHGIAQAVMQIGTVALFYTPARLMQPAMRGFDRTSRRLYSAYLRRVVDDPTTAAKLLPNFGPFGNRPTLNSSFPRAFNRDNVTLETTPIERIVPEGVKTTDGTVHEFDYLVTAVGWELFSEPTSYARGRVVGSRGADLGEFFTSNGMKAYESVAVPGFPNRWIIVGPYSWTGNGGWHGLVENAVTHVVRAIRLAGDRGATRTEVRPAALDRFHARMLHRGRNLKYYFTELNAGVHSYWVNADNEIPILRASTILQARRASRSFPADDYTYSRVSETTEHVRELSIQA